MSPKSGEPGDRGTWVDGLSAERRLCQGVADWNALPRASSFASEKRGAGEGKTIGSPAILNSRPSASGGTLLNDAVYAVSKGVLAKEPGRKAMVILSDGGDNGSRKSLAEAIEQAQRGDVQIYSILYSAWESMGGRPGAGPVGMRPGRPDGDPGQAALLKLSESTGGRVFTVSPTLSLREIFAQIGRDLRLQYELGYTPPLDVQPNSYHKLELRARDKKLVVQARRGFFAPP